MQSPEKLMDGITYDMVSPYYYTTKEELIKLKKGDMLSQMKTHYTDDVCVILNSLANAESINVPLLFYRNVDKVIAQNFSALYSGEATQHIADTSVYDCTLPFTEGIPSDKLLDVREEVPTAFIDFRTFLFELVTDTMKKTDSAAERKAIIENAVNKKLRLLQVEMENANKKWNYIGLAASASLAIGAGTLGIYANEIDISKVVQGLLGSTALVNGLRTWSDVSSQKNSAALNPTYFLWKVKQNS